MADILIPTDRPAYRILSEKGFFGPDCHLYQEGDCLVFDDEPNEEMEPLNDLAREKIKILFDKLDGLAREVAKANGRQFVERPRTLEGAVAMATIDAKRVMLNPGDGGVPLMGSTIGRDRAHKLEAAEPTPETGGVVRRGPGRPRKAGGALNLSR